ncbi:epsin-3-like [Carya illinoinensis]|uniref:ENTH domain-containing protein n=1 Tax=Carya illinoinensis TaxID=32201 RepID=A0A8T1RP95_CARIL|nr:epsin-3-like [Carya illinoinensis]KAG6668608.1 hypothetical protein CIPAW_01G182700 [Carya illinoinensis]
MGSLLLGQFKRQASFFLKQKYRTARLVFTDVSEAELLAEEATNNNPCSPDARTMTRIAEASFEVDDYWRIIDVLHRRFYYVDWKRWRQSYKSLVLLAFLLTHGPEDLAEEFQRDADIIQELGTFKHIDEKGFNWGVSMQKKSEEILKLLGGGIALKEARLKALKITKEIQGFGSPNTASPSSSTASTTPSSSSETSRFSSILSSYSTTSTPTWNDTYELNKHDQLRSPTKDSNSEEGTRDHEESNKYFTFKKNNVNVGSHQWDSPEVQESGLLLDSEDEKADGFISGICSKLAGISPSGGNDEEFGFMSFSDDGRSSSVTKKKFDRQYSLWY